ncbi:hypothetical protein BKA70DRAFT_1441417 [Coprinopsis sp. MPI-PUGE-AT-0042]|nr:hypothetical protein BKA70DRAFT_1441417 [Coprinopsis sp. MPI-PUGE-AT-0042]
MMHHASQQCNALQSVMGIFLHSCGTPETMRELLAHIGLSVSTTSINSAIQSLSKAAGIEAKCVGRELMSAYAMDNIDITLKHGTPTIEKPDIHLQQFTEGTMLPLREATPADINCSDELWKTSLHNPSNQPDPITKTPNPLNQRPVIPFTDLYSVHAEPDEPHPSGLTRRQRFCAWKILDDLINHGPE